MLQTHAYTWGPWMPKKHGQDDYAHFCSAHMKCTNWFLSCFLCICLLESSIAYQFFRYPQCEFSKTSQHLPAFMLRLLPLPSRLVDRAAKRTVRWFHQHGGFFRHDRFRLTMLTLLNVRGDGNFPLFFHQNIARTPKKTHVNIQLPGRCFVSGQCELKLGGDVRGDIFQSHVTCV